MITLGLQTLFMDHNICRNIDTVSNCQDLMSKVHKGGHTHLLFDFELSDGNVLEIIPNIKVICPYLEMMVYTGKDLQTYRSAFSRYKIHYHLPKTQNIDVTIGYLTRFLSKQPTEDLFSLPKEGINPLSRLAPRELEVLHLLVDGVNTNKIASDSGLRQNTISTVKSRIFEKLEVKSMRELVELVSPYLKD